MTTMIQTSAIATQQAWHRNGRANRIYQVIVNAEDGNYQEFEIEAASEQEAHAKADAIAMADFTDVLYVEVYRIA